MTTPLPVIHCAFAMTSLHFFYLGDAGPDCYYSDQFCHFAFVISVVALDM
jgi:hypothetical protein